MDRMHAGQDGQDACRTGWTGCMPDRMNAGQDGCRTGQMQNRTHAGQDGQDECRTGWMQDWADADDSNETKVLPYIRKSKYTQAFFG